MHLIGADSRQVPPQPHESDPQGGPCPWCAHFRAADECCEHDQALALLRASQRQLDEGLRRMPAAIATGSLDEFAAAQACFHDARRLQEQAIKTAWNQPAPGRGF